MWLSHSGHGDAGVIAKMHTGDRTGKQICARKRRPAAKLRVLVMLQSTWIKRISFCPWPYFGSNRPDNRYWWRSYTNLNCRSGEKAWRTVTFDSWPSRLLPGEAVLVEVKTSLLVLVLIVHRSTPNSEHDQEERVSRTATVGNDENKKGQINGA